MEKICFIHIPKCGGTSIRSSIKKNWLRNLINQGISLDSPASTKAARALGKDVLSYREGLLMYLLMSKNNYVFGHFKCTESTRKLFGDKWKFITLIRDPVKRWFSHYHFDRYRDEKKMMKTEMSMLEYLNTREGQQNSVMYVRHFSSCYDANNITSEHVDEAIRNILEFDVYGILERNDLFVKHYREKTNINLRIPYKNKNPKKNYTEQRIPQEIIDRVSEMCSYDMTIYQNVKSAVLKRESIKE